jgi:hypothetical protein
LTHESRGAILFGEIFVRA